MRRQVGVGLAVLLLGLLLPLAAWGKAKKPVKPKEPPKPPAEELVDVTGARDRMLIVSDGKGHYVAVVPFARGDDSKLTFYSPDGKSFYRLRIRGSGMSGKESWDQTFSEPRYLEGYKASLSWRDNKYTVQCDDRITELSPLGADDTKAVFAGATFLKARFKKYPYGLARDDKGVYYYVDRDLEPQGNKNFRLFVGPKGNLKLTKLVNVVSDSEGDIFATKKGELRLVLSKNDAQWIKGKARTVLTSVPVGDNMPMIFSELGVYAGEPLGTPCDDL